MWRYVLIGCLAGCIEPALVQCTDGLACSVGQVCDEIHRGCVSPGQISACTGAGSDADCIAGPITGGCFDGVCLPRGCGNGIVEPGEVCDDGNQISGDGCRGDCKSNERCGNGVLDSDENETCDDGNLMSHDGCDSKCQIETTSWQMFSLAPNSIARDDTAYDVARHRVVTVTGDGVTWEWDGSQWSTTLPPFSAITGLASPPQISLFYDPDHTRVGMISIQVRSSTTVAVFSTWDGTTWTEHSHIDVTVGSVPPLRAVTYDESLHRPVVALATYVDPSDNRTQYFSIDDSDAWIAPTNIPNLEMYQTGGRDAVAVYDRAGSRVVIVVGFRNTGTGETYAVTWSANPITGVWSYEDPYTDGLPDRMTQGGWSIFYDDARGQLVALDGAAMFGFTNGSWTLIAGTDPVPSTAPAAEYDAVAGMVHVLRTGANTIWSWDGTTWTSDDGPAPIAPANVAADPKSHRLVVRGGDAGNQTWAWDDAWQRLPVIAEPGARNSGQMAYDPARGQIVLHGGVNGGTLDDTWMFDGTNWSELSAAQPIAAPDTAPTSLGYDPTVPGVVLGYSNKFWDLPSNGTSWALEGNMPGASPNIIAVAWDAGVQRLVATDNSGLVYDRVGNTWDTSLALVGTGYHAIADERRGTLVVLPVDGSTTRSWTREHGAWTELDPLPMPIAGTVAYDPVRGRLMIVGTSLGGSYALVRTTASSAPDESCAPGDDLDSDGLIGCADPDCWWACTPACPPYTTCP